MRKDLTGRRFGRLTCLEPVGKNKYGVIWKCLCDCGNTTMVNRGNLLGHNTKSCGCLQRHKARTVHLIHGDDCRNSVSGLYRRWADMKTRVKNPNCRSAKNYGDRGVSLCKQWEQYEPFRDWALSHGYRDDLTLDRIDVDGDYCPENCRWITIREQCRNKRNTLLYRNIPVVELCEKTNTNYHSIMTAVYRAVSRGKTRESVFARYFGNIKQLKQEV